MVPPAPVTMPYTVARPSPVPRPFGLVVKNGSNNRSRGAPSLPTPEAETPEPEVPARVQARPAGGVGLVDLDVAGVDGQPAATRHRVPRVHGQVEQYLLQLAAVGLDRPQLRVRVDAQLDVLAQRPAQQFHGALHGLVEVEHLGPGHLVPGEREQLAGPPAGPPPGPARCRTAPGSASGRPRPAAGSPRR